MIYSLSMKVCTCALYMAYPYSNLFFLALKKAIADYDAKQAGNAMDKTLYSLGWTVDELSRLNEQCRHLHVDMTTTIEQ